MTNNTENKITTDLVFHISYEGDSNPADGMKKLGIQVEHVDCGDPVLDRFADDLGIIVADFLEKYPEAVAKVHEEIEATKNAGGQPENQNVAE